MFCRRRTGIRGDGARGGFSLVEVALALTVAAGGMISIFGIPGFVSVAALSYFL